MVISNNPEPHKSEFIKLLDKTNQLLTKEFSNSKSIKNIEGRKFEPIVMDFMSHSALKTPFEGTIELISGQKFPDIIANKFYGLEVKTSTQEHWTTTGNSVLEGTRVESVERIYLLFAQIKNNIQIKIKPYENCLSDVVVTHSPRYLIDMELSKGNTIFDKLNISYDDLRTLDNPIKPIISYYKKLLKPGEALWWLDDNQLNNSSKATNIVMRIWNSLSQQERNDFQIKGMAYFPEVFSNHSDKFSNLSLWLASTEGIVCNNIRDLYSAGGKVNLVFEGRRYLVPRIIGHLFDNLIEIRKLLLSVDLNFISETWDIKGLKRSLIIDKWIELVNNKCTELPGFSSLKLNIGKAINNFYKRN